MRRGDFTWLFSTLVIVLIFVWISNDPKGVTDMNIHDTYFVIANEYFWFCITVTIFSFSYLLKCLLNGFSSRSSNLILLVSWGLTAFIVVPASQFLFMASGFDDGLEGTPPADFWKNVYLGLKVFYILVLAVFGFLAFKTGQNWGNK
ncbi:MAG: hypothetical protein CMH48_07565 [Muricauda sp.]|nr:hypothetical protein [Allomuricauda sp.]